MTVKIEQFQMLRKCVIGVVFSLLFGGLCGHARTLQTDTLALEVFFPVNGTSIEFFFAGNGARIREFQQAWDAICRQNNAQIQDVLITGSASPEGSAARNRRLSEERARRLGQYLAPLLGAEESSFRYEIREPVPLTDANADWSAYRSASALVQLVVQRPVEEEARPEPEPEVKAQVQPEAAPVVETAPAPQPQEDKPQTQPEPRKDWDFAIRTNLLLPALNVGIEVPLGNRWSVGADWYYPWLWRRRQHEGVDYQGWCVQALALNLEGRYWLGERTRENRLKGHSVGLFTMAGYYDFENEYKGLQGEFATVGVDYLYALPLQNNWRMEFSLGLGYFYSQARNYEVYTVGGKGYKEKDMAKIIQWFGPVKANVSLVIPIRCRKGGGK